MDNKKINAGINDDNALENSSGVKQLDDEEVTAVNGGMKIVIDDQPSWLRPLLRLLFKIKD